MKYDARRQKCKRDGELQAGCAACTGRMVSFMPKAKAFLCHKSLLEREISVARDEQHGVMGLDADMVADSPCVLQDFDCTRL